MSKVPESITNRLAELDQADATAVKTTAELTAAWKQLPKYLQASSLVQYQMDSERAWVGGTDRAFERRGIKWTLAELGLGKVAK